MKSVPCDFCGDTLERYLSEINNKNFCNNTCRAEWQKSQRVEEECAECGKVLEVEPSEAEKFDNHFCDNDCQGKWYGSKPEEEYYFYGRERPEHSKFMEGSGNPAKRDEVRTILSKQVSGDSNPAKRSDVREKISTALSGRTLSDETKHKISQAKKKWHEHNQNPAKRKKVREKIREAKKGEEWSQQQKKEQSKRIQEWHRNNEHYWNDKISESLKEYYEDNEHHFKGVTGEDHHSWRGGSSFEPYPSEFNESLKEEIRERDNRECQMCGRDEEEHRGRLCVHHIDGNKGNCSKDNLVAVCRACNTKIEFLSDRPTFSTVV